jgi:hypothetical protein
MIAMTDDAVEQLALRARILAADLGITIEWFGDAGPEYDMGHAGRCLVARLGTPGSDADLMLLQDVTDFGPYEFGCDWVWIAPLTIRSLDRPKGQDVYYTRAIPVRDLPTLVACLESCAQADVGIPPDGYEISVHRGPITLVASLYHGHEPIGRTRGWTWRGRQARLRLARAAWDDQASRQRPNQTNDTGSN